MHMQRSTVVTAGSYVIGYVEPSKWCQDAGTSRCEAIRIRQDRTTVSLGRYPSHQMAADAICNADVGRKGPEPLEFVDDV